MPRFTFLQDFISAKPIKILSNTLRDKHFGGMIPMSDRRVSRPELCSRVSAVDQSEQTGYQDDRPPGPQTLHQNLQGIASKNKFFAQCRECQGSGKLGEKDCPICGGTGVVIEEIGGG